MALLRNRQVQLVGISGGEAATDMFTVRYPDGSQETTQLRFLTLSEDEKEDFAKANGTRYSDQVTTLSDSDYQDIVDSQDPKKIKEKQDAAKEDQPTPTPVTIVDTPKTPTTSTTDVNSVSSPKAN